jgi:hypothetical protein
MISYYLHDDRKIQIRIRSRVRIYTSDKRILLLIWIREAQKHVGPDPGSAPEHCYTYSPVTRRVSSN